jgi:hypothetical protein
MFTAIGCFVGSHCPNDDVEDRIGVVVFAVNDLALLESNNRRHNSEAGAFVIG